MSISFGESKGAFKTFIIYRDDDVVAYAKWVNRLSGWRLIDRAHNGAFTSEGIIKGAKVNVKMFKHKKDLKEFATRFYSHTKVKD